MFFCKDVISLSECANDIYILLIVHLNHRYDHFKEKFSCASNFANNLNNWEPGVWVSHFLESCVKSCAINIWAKQPTTKQGASTITNFIPKLNFFSHLNFVGLTIALKNTIQTIQHQCNISTILKITHLIIIMSFR